MKEAGTSSVAAVRKHNDAGGRSSVRKRKMWEAFKIAVATLIAAGFAILFLMPIVLTITNSFMASSEISANYGSVFARTDTGGKVYISEKVN